MPCCGKRRSRISPRLIKTLLDLEGEVANARTTKGFGKILSSLMILEVAKESAGQLRANGSSLLVVNKPLSGDQFALVLKLKSEVDANLTSPALVLSKKSRENLAAFQTRESWRRTEEILKTLILKAGEGNFGVAGDAFFEVISRKIDDMAGLIDGETASMVDRLRAETDAFKRSLFVTMAGLVVLAGLVLGLALGFARNISRRIRQVVSSLKDIAEGQGDLTIRLPEGSRDELGDLARYFNGFSGQLQNILREVRENSATLASSSTEMSAIAGQMSGGAQGTSAKAATVATAAEEMSANTSSVAAGHGAGHHEPVLGGDRDRGDERHHRRHRGQLREGARDQRGGRRAGRRCRRADEAARVPRRRRSAR